MKSSDQVVLSARNLNKVWVDGSRQINIAIEELDLKAGDFVAITGPSGCGKSTVLDMLSLVLRPDAGGELRINNGGKFLNARALMENQNESALAKLRASVFGYVVQTSELIPFLTVMENCLLQQQISGRGSRDDVFVLADALDVTALVDAYPRNLSVGQRQRVAIVRALCCLPAIVLADEPTSAQDPQLKDKVIKVLKNAAKRGTAVVMVTHDTALVQQHGIRNVSLEAGLSGDNWYSRFYERSMAS